MTYHGTLSQRSLILVQLSKAPQTRISLAKTLGFKAAAGVSRVVNTLIADGKITETDTIECPKCHHLILCVPLLKEGKTLRLTDTGQAESLESRNLLKAILGDLPPEGGG